MGVGEVRVSVVVFGLVGFEDMVDVGLFWICDACVLSTSSWVRWDHR
jgi:hypothetical protein